MHMECKNIYVTSMAKVLCKHPFDFPRFENPCFENPHFENLLFRTGHCITGKSKSAIIGPYSKFQKHIHDGSCLEAGQS